MPTHKKQLILALDIGTSSVRAALYDHAGNVLRQTRVKNERTLTVTDDGGAELDAEEAFDQVVEAIDDVLRKAEKIKGEITHAAASCFWHSLVGVDAKGKPTTKVLGWADTRSRGAVAALRKKFNEPEVHNSTGARFHSSFWPAKLLWLQKEFPAVWKKTTQWLGLSDYISLRLFGDPTTSVSMASATGMFDIRVCEWDGELSRFLKLRPDSFPLIAAVDSQTFRVSEKFAKRWPRLAGAEWFPAIGDGATNNIGAGCVQKSKAALMIGTSGAMRVAYKGDPPEKIPPGLWCYRIDRRRVIIGGALSDGGGLFRWLKDNLRLSEIDDETEDEIAKRPPAGHGLVFLPFLAGERSTGYHENATGAVLGLHSSTDTIDIVQAALESVAYRFAEIFDQLNSVVKVREIIASGGTLRESPVWTQIIADTLGRNLTLPDTREASSRGAVLLALETIGKIEKIEQIPTPTGKKFSCDRRGRKSYQKSAALHKRLYGHLCSVALIFVALFTSAAGQQSGACPTLEVIAPAGLIFPMQRVTVVALLTGDVGPGAISYEWKSASGRIVGGQGTSAIVLYVGEDDQRKNVGVTVTAYGQFNGCEVKGSGIVAVAPLLEWDIPLDWSGRVGPGKTDLWDFLGRIDSFLAAIANRPGSDGFLVIDFNSKDSTQHKVRHLKRIFDHLSFRKFDLARLTIGMSEHSNPERTTFMGTWPPKALVPKYVRGYKIINAEDYRANIGSLFPLDSSAAQTFREPAMIGPDQFWFELPTKDKDFQREIEDFFDDLENNPDHEGIVEITYGRHGSQNAKNELISRVEDIIDNRHFDRTRISYFAKIGENERIRIIRVPSGSNYNNVGIDPLKLIKAEEYKISNTVDRRK